MAQSLIQGLIWLASALSPLQTPPTHTQSPTLLPPPLPLGSPRSVGSLLPWSPTHRNSPQGASAASQPRMRHARVPLSSAFCSVVGLLVLLPKASWPCGPPLTPRPRVTARAELPRRVHFLRPLPLQLAFDSDQSSHLSVPPREVSWQGLHWSAPHPWSHPSSRRQRDTRHRSLAVLGPQPSPGFSSSADCSSPVCCPSRAPCQPPAPGASPAVECTAAGCEEASVVEDVQVLPAVCLTAMLRDSLGP